MKRLKNILKTKARSLLPSTKRIILYAIISVILVLSTKLILVDYFPKNISHPNHDFNEIVRYTIKREGGYNNDASDKGGETKFGISKVNHPNVDVANLTEEQAIEIYKKQYWDTTNIPRLKDKRIAQKLFDMSVLMGHKQAVIMLQRALLASGRDVLTDGDLGRKTVKKVNECTNMEGLLWCFIGEIANYFRDVVQVNPSQRKFLDGWNNRAYDDFDDSNNDL